MNWLLGLGSAFFYLLFQSKSVYGGDGGDLVSAAYLRGIPHPPGFPLYTFLGHILTKVPIGTVAWRVGVLSSLPSALTLVFLFLILKEIYQNKILAAISILVLAFTYPFWLFAITVEVYALNTLFAVLFVYLLLRWRKRRRIKTLFLTFFVFGLGLSHHQILFFLTPALFYLVYLNRRFLPKDKIKFSLLSLFLISLGFLTYLYSYLAAKAIPILSWNNPYNARNLLRLISKEIYGVFYAGPDFAAALGSRFLDIFAYFLFIFEDFTVIGVVLIILGLFWGFRKKRSLTLFFFLAFFFSGPFLYFYASFRLGYLFKVAVFEQFLSFSYLFLIFFLCGGLIFLQKFLGEVFARLRLNLSKAPWLPSLISGFFLLYPFFIFYINYPKLSILRDDFTAERFGEDILKTPVKNAVLILQRDNALFDSQYLYYTQKLRPDIKLFHFQKLFVGEANPQIKKYYPELFLPKGEKQEFIDNFIAKNYKHFPIYTNQVFTVNIKDSFWVRYGLLYRLYKKEKLPKLEEIISENERLWQGYQDPLSGSLGKYKNLFLANVLDYYKEAHLQTGVLYLTAKKYKKALSHYQEARRLNPEDPEIFVLTGRAYLAQKNCQEAKEFFEKAISLRQKKGKEEASLYLLLQETYKDCFKDEERAHFYERLYQQKRREMETPIEKL